MRSIIVKNNIIHNNNAFLQFTRIKSRGGKLISSSTSKTITSSGSRSIHSMKSSSLVYNNMYHSHNNNHIMKNIFNQCKNNNNNHHQNVYNNINIIGRQQQSRQMITKTIRNNNNNNNNSHYYNNIYNSSFNIRTQHRRFVMTNNNKKRFNSNNSKGNSNSNSNSISKTKGNHHHKKSSIPRVIGGFTVVTAGIMGGYAYYQFIYLPEQERNIIELPPEVIIDPPDEFMHPFESKSTLWKICFKIKRFLTLGWIFSPLIWKAIWAQLRGGHKTAEEERQFDIDFNEHLARCLQEAGCSFLKLGQWISMRPDMFSHETIKAMSTLRDQVPAHAMEDTRRIMKEAFGKEIEDMFDEFEIKPIASGSVAQVYRAKLKPEYAGKVENENDDGGNHGIVAVKVRHPTIMEETFVDFDIIFQFIATVFPDKYAIPGSQDELTNIVQQQLDFNWEAYNLQRFAQNFQKDIEKGLIEFPIVSKELVTDTVLIESWMEGSPVAEIMSKIEMNEETGRLMKLAPDEFDKQTEDKKKYLARTIFDMNLKMFLRDNYVHGDLHAGNILYNPVSNSVTVLDAGLTTMLKKDIYDSFGDFLRGVCNSDPELICDKLIEFNSSGHDVDVPAFRRKLTELTSTWIDEDGNHLAIGDMVGAILMNLQKYKIVLRGDIAAAIASISVSEGLILSLDPEFDIVLNALPYFVRYRGWKDLAEVKKQMKNVD